MTERDFYLFLKTRYLEKKRRTITLYTIRKIFHEIFFYLKLISRFALIREEKYP